MKVSTVRKAIRLVAMLAMIFIEMAVLLLVVFKRF